MEYVVGQDEVSAKPATLEGKDIQSTKPILVWLFSQPFDHTRGQALYALHQGDVSFMLTGPHDAHLARISTSGVSNFLYRIMTSYKMRGRSCVIGPLV